MQLAAQFAGLTPTEASGLVGALREIEENVHLHSGRSDDAIVGYRATAQEFEFVVADSGMGALRSLQRSPEYADLNDAGRAITLVLTDGVSRLNYCEPGHGLGFHQLFVGLANLNSSLRFRSDDHVLTIEGTAVTRAHQRIAQRPRLQGFTVHVVCRPIRP